MIAYNKIWLNNLFILRETAIAADEDCITKEERDNISLAYPASFYSPNIFIRIGLFILTMIIMIFSFGLFVLISLNNIEKLYGGLAVFFAVLAIVALEYMLQRKKHYQSGVDDALLWGAAIAFFCGISFPYNLGNLENCLLIFIITLLSTIRFADRLMATICFISFLGVIFFACSEAGDLAKTIVPFIIMAISLATYILARKMNDKNAFNIYGGCMVMIEIVSLLTLYIAGNYWIVRELSDSMFHLQLQPGQSIPFGFIFWILTIFIPLFYLFRGIQKKDAILLRVGMLLIAATIFTIRYYHAVLVPEAAMVLAGSIMLVFAWALSRYLRSPKYGFTEQELNSRLLPDHLHIESLVIAETFSQQPQPADNSQFGGGSFGGGGASSDF